MRKMEYPSGAKFAFTILDDTDDTTVQNGKPVYDLLHELGMRTTKTVWAFDTPPENKGPYFAGETLSSPEYLAWVHELSNKGFEIAFHNATMGSSTRSDTIKALDFLEKEFETTIRLHCNHGQNKENIYWGIDRYKTPVLKQVLAQAAKHRDHPTFEGQQVNSPYYWADIAEQRLSYMRAFAYERLNCLELPPGRPFKDPLKSPSPVLFNTADAPDVHVFNRLVNPKSLEKLKRQGGWSIVSTHFGKGFWSDGRVNADFEKTMRYLSSQGGWCVPVSELLDHLGYQSEVSEISTIERLNMEVAHLFDRLKTRI